MKRLINRLLIFGLTFTLFVLGVWFISLNASVVETHFVAKRTDEGGTRLRTEEFESLYSSPNDSLDFLFLGSSTCYCGIDPYSLEVNGYASFSLCSSAQRIGNSSDILDYALTHCTPKTVVVDIYPQLWSGPISSVECERDWIINGSSLPLRRIEPYNLLLKGYFKISEAFGVEHEPWPLCKIERHVESVDSVDCGEVYSGLGFIERHVESVDSVDCNEPDKIIMPNEIKEVLIQMSQKTNVVLVLPPVLCESKLEIEGFTVIDGNLWPGAKDKSNFYDDHHLVSEGAKSYSGWLSEKLILLSKDPSL